MQACEAVRMLRRNARARTGTAAQTAGTPSWGTADQRRARTTPTSGATR
jgi:hypothetical protein